MSQSVFETVDGHVRGTELARGPWDPGAQHGGAPAALIAGAVEALPRADGLRVARLTYEFLRPVPLGELVLEAGTVAAGRRVARAQASLSTPERVEVVRADALLVHAAQTRRGGGAPDPPPGDPAQGRENDLVPPFRPMFAPDAIEVRFSDGSFHALGPSSAWFRLRVPILDGQPPSPLQRLAAAGDFGNGISSPVSWDDHLFINPDLTLYVEREPEGEWIGLEARTRIVDGGVGVSESVLYDMRGRVGRAIQSLLVAPR